MKAFTMRFFLRKSLGNDPLSKLFARVTTGNRRVDFSLNRRIDPTMWDEKSSTIKGRKDSDRELVKYLSTVEEAFYKIERELIENSMPVTADTLVKAFNDKITGRSAEKRITLMTTFDKHNEQLAELFKAGKVGRPTLSRYYTTKAYLEEFLVEKSGIKDMPLDELDVTYAKEFDHWLRTRKNCSHNTVIKYVKNIRKIIRVAIDYGWLEADPFKAYQGKAKTVSRDILTLEEIRRIECLETPMARLDNVRKLFLFSCYTGLAYIDLISLTPQNIVLDNQGAKWILKERKKTKVISRIYLLPSAEKIIDEYKKNPVALQKGTVFPPISNQRLNGYLKEIATLAGIEKNLTFHCGRHTFATTVSLANGVSLESVSAQLGHTNIRQTQHYARMVDSRIGREMALIKGLFS